MPTPINPALRIAGPAFIKTRDAAFFSKGAITVTPQRATFAIDTNRDGALELREESMTYQIQFTPTGDFNALSVLWPYGIARPGELIHAVATVSSIDDTTEIITFNSLARFRDGAPVRFATRGTAPTGLTAGTLYYLHKLSATTGTLHTSEANALAGTSPVNITGSGTGLHTIIEEEYLYIQPFDGSAPFQFHNVQVAAQPELNLTAGATAIGAVTFEAFRKFATAPTDAAAFYSRPSAITDDTFDPADILTQAYDVAWGASAPWSAISTRDGVRVAFGLTLQPWGDDAGGILTRQITAIECQARAIPVGLAETDLWDKLVVQGTGAGRGRRIQSSDPLNISATGLYVRLYNAILEDPGAASYDLAADRTAELTWRAQRAVTSGVTGDLYYVGASAPA